MTKTISFDLSLFEFLDIVSVSEKSAMADDVVYEYWDILVYWLEHDLKTDLKKYLNMLPLDKIHLFFYDGVIFKKNDTTGYLEISRPGSPVIEIDCDDILYDILIGGRRMISGKQLDINPGSGEHRKFINLLDDFYENGMVYVTL